ncbi:MAG TPA: hypothetical protein VKG43_02245 [Acidimicrobiales bacterium]|nr:hypothetical protein [Acidimicrobiales bacterium]
MATTNLGPGTPAARHPRRARRRLAALALATPVALSVPVVAPLAAGASTPPTVTAAARGHLGMVLVTGSGVTLYHLTADKPNKPTCTGGCNSIWPALLLAKGSTKPVAGGGVSGLGTVKVANGRLQVTYHGEPLYRYVLDGHPGDTKGQGVDGVWFVVKKSAATTASSSTTTSHSSSYGGY